jgi:5-(carboxyamino)imidazole ribonucleotide mutase
MGAKIQQISADRLGKSTCKKYGWIAFFDFFRKKGIKTMKKVAIIMGSDSDLPIVEKGIAVLDELSVPYEVHVYSAHRTPSECASFVSGARERGFGAIICAAGMAAHLAGAVAANTLLPVIGIPISSKNTGGADALWSTVQMPSGIPVATVAIDGAQNAAYLAAEILSLSDDALYERLLLKRTEGKNKVLSKNADIEAKYNK